MRGRAAAAMLAALFTFVWVLPASADEQFGTTAERAIVAKLSTKSTNLERDQLFDLTLDPADKAEAVTWFGLLDKFKFPNDALVDVTVNPAKERKGSAFGVDISHHNGGSFPLALLAKRHILFAYAKASQGTTVKDKQFKHNWLTMDGLTGDDRIHRGAYHFLSAATNATAEASGKAQADVFVAVVDVSGGLKDTDMPPVVDLEWDVTSKNSQDRWAGMNGDAILKEVLAFVKEVEARTGRKPMIYTARSWWVGRIGSESKYSALADYPLWIADYSKTSRGVEQPKVINGVKPLIWQFTATAGLAHGVGGDFDADIFKGTPDGDPGAELLAQAGVKPFS